MSLLFLLDAVLLLFQKKAVDFSKLQICVDLFLFSAGYTDVATLVNLPKFTAGQLFYYPVRPDVPWRPFEQTRRKAVGRVDVEVFKTAHTWLSLKAGIPQGLYMTCRSKKTNGKRGCTVCRAAIGVLRSFASVLRSLDRYGISSRQDTVHHGGTYLKT